MPHNPPVFRYSVFLRFTALVTLLTFSVPQDLRAMVVASGPQRETQREVPFLVNTVSIPSSIGKIEEIYQASPESPRVVLIQDAHSIPDAQKNIQKLIHHFQKQYGIGLVALEGASSKLDPQILRSFPDKEKLEKTLDQYFEKGELTGSSAAAIFSPGDGNKTVFQGIEDWKMYEEGLGLYLKAMKNQPEILKSLHARSKDLAAKKEKIYSKELLEIDKMLQSFEENHQSLVEVLKRLSRIKRPPQSTELELILAEAERENLDSKAEFLEVGTIAKNMQRLLQKPWLRSRLAEFNAKFQEFKTSQISASAFAFYLRELSELSGVPLPVSVPLDRLIKNQKRLANIEGSKLFRDFEDYAEEIMAFLIRNEEQGGIKQESRKLALLGKLVRLELTRAEWNEAQPLAQNPQWTDHLAFYQNAEKRDDIFLNQLSSLMRERKTESAILIAGGFHAEGLMARLKENNISYLLLTPQINSIPQENYYLNHMKGDVSWKSYFRVENGRVHVYQAFVRAVRDRLMAGHSSLFLKSWRDQIIRDLAQEGGLERAGDYTGFLDEISKDGNQNHSVKDKLRKINEFIKGLRHLEIRGELTGPNVLKLLQPSAVPAVAIAIQLASGNTMRWPLIEDPVGSGPAARSEVRKIEPSPVVMKYLAPPPQDIKKSKARKKPRSRTEKATLPAKPQPRQWLVFPVNGKDKLNLHARNFQEMTKPLTDKEKIEFERYLVKAVAPVVQDFEKSGLWHPFREKGHDFKAPGETWTGEEGVLTRLQFYNPIISRKYFIDRLVLPHILRHSPQAGAWSVASWDDPRQGRPIAREKERMIHLMRDTVEHVISKYGLGDIHIPEFIQEGYAKGLLPYFWQRLLLRVNRLVSPEVMENIVSAMFFSIISIVLAFLRSVFHLEKTAEFLSDFVVLRIGKIQVNIADVLFAAIIVGVLFRPQFEKFENWLKNLERDYHDQILGRVFTRITAGIYHKNLEKFENDFARLRGRFEPSAEPLFRETQHVLIDIGNEKQRYLRFVQSGSLLIDSGIKLDAETVIVAMLADALGHNPERFEVHVRRWESRQEWADKLWEKTSVGRSRGPRPENQWDRLLALLPLIRIQQHDYYRDHYAWENAQPSIDASEQSGIETSTGEQQETLAEEISKIKNEETEAYHRYLAGKLIHRIQKRRLSIHKRRQTILAYFGVSLARLRYLEDNYTANEEINPEYAERLFDMGETHWPGMLQRIHDYQNLRNKFGLSKGEIGVLLAQIREHLQRAKAAHARAEVRISKEAFIENLKQRTAQKFAAASSLNLDYPSWTAHALYQVLNGTILEIYEFLTKDQEPDGIALAQYGSLSRNLFYGVTSDIDLVIIARDEPQLEFANHIKNELSDILAQVIPQNGKEDQFVKLATSRPLTPMETFTWAHSRFLAGDSKVFQTFQQTVHASSGEMAYQAAFLFNFLERPMREHKTMEGQVNIKSMPGGLKDLGILHQFAESHRGYAALPFPGAMKVLADEGILPFENVKDLNHLFEILSRLRLQGGVEVKPDELRPYQDLIDRVAGVVSFAEDEIVKRMLGLDQIQNPSPFLQVYLTGKMTDPDRLQAIFSEKLREAGGKIEEMNWLYLAAFSSNPATPASILEKMMPITKFRWSQKITTNMIAHPHIPTEALQTLSHETAINKEYRALALEKLQSRPAKSETRSLPQIKNDLKRILKEVQSGLNRQEALREVDQLLADWLSQESISGLPGLNYGWVYDSPSKKFLLAEGGQELKSIAGALQFHSFFDGADLVIFIDSLRFEPKVTGRALTHWLLKQFAEIIPKGHRVKIAGAILHTPTLIELAEDLSSKIDLTRQAKRRGALSPFAKLLLSSLDYYREARGRRLALTPASGSEEAKHNVSLNIGLAAFYMLKPQLLPNQAWVEKKSMGQISRLHGIPAKILVGSDNDNDSAFLMFELAFFSQNDHAVTSKEQMEQIMSEEADLLLSRILPSLNETRHEELKKLLIQSTAHRFNRTFSKALWTGLTSGVLFALAGLGRSFLIAGLGFTAGFILGIITQRRVEKSPHVHPIFLNINLADKDLNSEFNARRTLVHEWIHFLYHRNLLKTDAASSAVDRLRYAELTGDVHLAPKAWPWNHGFALWEGFQAMEGVLEKDDFKESPLSPVLAAVLEKAGRARISDYLFTMALSPERLLQYLIWSMVWILTGFRFKLENYLRSFRLGGMAISLYKNHPALKTSEGTVSPAWIFSREILAGKTAAEAYAAVRPFLAGTRSEIRIERLKSFLPFRGFIDSLKKSGRWEFYKKELLDFAFPLIAVSAVFIAGAAKETIFQEFPFTPTWGKSLIAISIAAFLIMFFQHLVKESKHFIQEKHFSSSIFRLLTYPLVAISLLLWEAKAPYSLFNHSGSSWLSFLPDTRVLAEMTLDFIQRIPVVGKSSLFSWPALDAVLKVFHLIISISILLPSLFAAFILPHLMWEGFLGLGSAVGSPKIRRWSEDWKEHMRSFLPSRSETRGNLISEELLGSKYPIRVVARTLYSLINEGREDEGAIAIPDATLPAHDEYFKRNLHGRIMDANLEFASAAGLPEAAELQALVKKGKVALLESADIRSKAVDSRDEIKDMLWHEQLHLALDDNPDISSTVIQRVMTTSLKLIARPRKILAEFYEEEHTLGEETLIILLTKLSGEDKERKAISKAFSELLSDNPEMFDRLMQIRKELEPSEELIEAAIQAANNISERKKTYYDEIRVFFRDNSKIRSETRGNLISEELLGSKYPIRVVSPTLCSLISEAEEGRLAVAIPDAASPAYRDLERNIQWAVANANLEFASAMGWPEAAELQAMVKKGKVTLLESADIRSKVNDSPDKIKSAIWHEQLHLALDDHPDIAAAVIQRVMSSSMELIVEARKILEAFYGDRAGEETLIVLLTEVFSADQEIHEKGILKKFRELLSDNPEMFDRLMQIRKEVEPSQQLIETVIQAANSVSEEKSTYRDQMKAFSRSENPEMGYREKFEEMGLSSQEIEELEKYTKEFLDNPEHRMFIRRNQKELLDSLADEDLLSYALLPLPAPHKEAANFRFWKKQVFFPFVEASRDYLNRMNPEILIKIFSRKIFIPEREFALWDFLTGVLPQSNRLTPEERQMLASLDSDDSLVEQGVTLTALKDFSSGRGLDPGEMVWRLTLSKDGRSIPIFLKGVGKGIKAEMQTQQTNIQAHETFFFEIAKLLGLNSIESYHYSEDRDQSMFGFVLMEDARAQNMKDIFIEEEKRPQLNADLISQKEARALIPQLARYAAVSDFLHGTDRKIYQLERSQFPANYMVDLERFKKGEPSVISIDHQFLFNATNDFVASDLERSADAEMGILIALDDFFESGEGRERLFEEYRRVYLDEWHEIRIHREAIEAKVIQTFGEDSHEHKIILSELAGDPEEHFDQQKAALLKLVEKPLRFYDSFGFRRWNLRSNIASAELLFSMMRGVSFIHKWGRYLFYLVGILVTLNLALQGWGLPAANLNFLLIPLGFLGAYLFSLSVYLALYHYDRADGKVAIEGGYRKDVKRYLQLRSEILGYWKNSLQDESPRTVKEYQFNKPRLTALREKFKYWLDQIARPYPALTSDLHDRVMDVAYERAMRTFEDLVLAAKKILQKERKNRVEIKRQLKHLVVGDDIELQKTIHNFLQDYQKFRERVPFAPIRSEARQEPKTVAVDGASIHDDELRQSPTDGQVIIKRVISPAEMAVRLEGMEVLMKELMAHDGVALSEFIRQAYPQLSHPGNFQDWEDRVQNAAIYFFLKHERIQRKYDPARDSPENYLSMVIRSRGIRFGRKKGKVPALESDVEIDQFSFQDSQISRDKDPAESAEISDSAQLAKGFLLPRLEEDERALFVARAEGKPLKEIAREANLPLDQVSRTLTAAKVKMQIMSEALDQKIPPDKMALHRLESLIRRMHEPHRAIATDLLGGMTTREIKERYQLDEAGFLKNIRNIHHTIYIIFGPETAKILIKELWREMTEERPSEKIVKATHHRKEKFMPVDQQFYEWLLEARSNLPSAGMVIVFDKIMQGKLPAEIAKEHKLAGHSFNKQYAYPIEKHLGEASEKRGLLRRTLMDTLKAVSANNRLASAAGADGLARSETRSSVNPAAKLAYYLGILESDADLTALLKAASRVQLLIDDISLQDRLPFLERLWNLYLQRPKLKTALIQSLVMFGFGNGKIKNEALRLLQNRAEGNDDLLIAALSGLIRGINEGWIQKLPDAFYSAMVPLISKDQHEIIGGIASNIFITAWEKKWLSAEQIRKMPGLVEKIRTLSKTHPGFFAAEIDKAFLKALGLPEVTASSFELQQANLYSDANLAAILKEINSPHTMTSQELLESLFENKSMVLLGHYSSYIASSLIKDIRELHQKGILTHFALPLEPQFESEFSRWKREGTITADTRLMLSAYLVGAVDPEKLEARKPGFAVQLDAAIQDFHEIISRLPDTLEIFLYGNSDIGGDDEKIAEQTINLAKRLENNAARILVFSHRIRAGKIDLVQPSGRDILLTLGASLNRYLSKEKAVRIAYVLEEDEDAWESAREHNLARLMALYPLRSFALMLKGSRLADRPFSWDYEQTTISELFDALIFRRENDNDGNRNFTRPPRVVEPLDSPDLSLAGARSEMRTAPLLETDARLRLELERIKEEPLSDLTDIAFFRVTKGFGPYTPEQAEILFDAVWQRFGPQELTFPPELKKILLEHCEHLNLSNFATGWIGVKGINALKEAGVLSREHERFLWKVFHRARSKSSNREDYLVSDENVQELMTHSPYPKMILDLGSGPKGMALAKLKDRYQDKVIAHGIDLEGSQKAHPDIFLVQGDITELPYADNSFDLIYESEVLHYFAEGGKLGKVLVEALRVLKPGGKFIFKSTDFFTRGKIVDALEAAGLPYGISQYAPYVITKGSAVARSETRNLDMDIAAMSDNTVIPKEAMIFSDPDTGYHIVDMNLWDFDPESDESREILEGLSEQLAEIYRTRFEKNSFGLRSYLVWEQMIGAKKNELLVLMNREGKIEGFLLADALRNPVLLDRIASRENGIKSKGTWLLHTFFKKMQRQGQLEIEWYSSSDATYGFYNRVLVRPEFSALIDDFEPLHYPDDEHFNIRLKPLRSETRAVSIPISKKQIEGILNARIPEEKVSRLTDFIHQSPAMLNALWDTPLASSPMGRGPLYQIQKEGVPVLIISLFSGFIVDFSTNVLGDKFDLDLLRGDEPISQEQFFKLKFISSKKTVADLFREKGLGKFVEEGLPLETDMDFFYDSKSGTIQGVSTIHEDPMAQIVIDTTETGDWKFSGFGAGIANIRSESIYQGAKWNGLIPLFGMHTHPDENFHPGYTDMEFMVREPEIPQMIVTPSGKARMWAVWDQKGLKSLINHRLWRSPVWEPEQVQKMAKQYLYWVPVRDERPGLAFDALRHHQFHDALRKMDPIDVKLSRIQKILSSSSVLDVLKREYQDLRTKIYRFYGKPTPENWHQLNQALSQKAEIIRQFETAAAQIETLLGQGAIEEDDETTLREGVALIKENLLSLFEILENHSRAIQDSVLQNSLRTHERLKIAARSFSHSQVGDITVFAFGLKWTTIKHILPQLKDDDLSAALDNLNAKIKNFYSGPTLKNLDEMDELLVQKAKISSRFEAVVAQIDALLQPASVNGDNEKEVRASIEVLRKNLIYLFETLENRVRFARAVPVQNPFDLRDVVYRSALTRDWRGGSEELLERVALHLPEEVIGIRGDELSLINGFNNIIRNGLAAVSSTAGDEGKIEVTLSSDQNQAVLTISDQGPGVLPELLAAGADGKKKLFELGASSKGKERGIGLAEAWHAVGDHGGTIEVNSELGKGTTFTIRLPLHAPRSETRNNPWPRDQIRITKDKSARTAWDKRLRWLDSQFRRYASFEDIRDKMREQFIDIFHRAGVFNKQFFSGLETIPPIFFNAEELKGLLQFMAAMNKEEKEILAILKRMEKKGERVYLDQGVHDARVRQFSFSPRIVSAYWVHENNLTLEEKVAMTMELFGNTPRRLDWLIGIAKLSKTKRRIVINRVKDLKKRYERAVQWHLRHTFPPYTTALALYHGSNKNIFDGRKWLVKDPVYMTFNSGLARSYVDEDFLWPGEKGAKEGQILQARIPLSAVIGFRKLHDRTNEIVVKEGIYPILENRVVPRSETRSVEDLPGPIQKIQQQLDQYLRDDKFDWSHQSVELKKFKKHEADYGGFILNPGTSDSQGYAVPPLYALLVRLAVLPENIVNSQASALIGFQLGADGRPDRNQPPIGWLLIYQHNGNTFMLARDKDGKLIQEAIHGSRRKTRKILTEQEVWIRFSEALLYPKSKEKLSNLALFLLLNHANSRREKEIVADGQTRSKGGFYNFGPLRFQIPEMHRILKGGTALSVFFDESRNANWVLIIPSDEIAAVRQKAERLADIPWIIFHRNLLLPPGQAELFDKMGQTDVLNSSNPEAEGSRPALSLMDSGKFRFFLTRLEKPWKALPLEQKKTFVVALGDRVGMAVRPETELVLIRRKGEVPSAEGGENNQIFVLHKDTPILHVSIQEITKKEDVLRNYPRETTLLEALSQNQENGFNLPPDWIEKIGEASLFSASLSRDDPGMVEIKIDGKQKPFLILKTFHDASNHGESAAHFAIPALAHLLSRIEGDPFLLRSSPLREALSEPRWNSVRLYYSVIFWKDPARTPWVVRNDEIKSFTEAIDQNLVARIIDTESLAPGSRSETRQPNQTKRAVEEKGRYAEVFELFRRTSRNAGNMDELVQDLQEPLQKLIRAAAYNPDFRMLARTLEVLVRDITKVGGKRKVHLAFPSPQAIQWLDKFKELISEYDYEPFTPLKGIYVDLQNSLGVRARGKSKNGQRSGTKGENKNSNRVLKNKTNAGDPWEDLSELYAELEIFYDYKAGKDGKYRKFTKERFKKFNHLMKHWPLAVEMIEIEEGLSVADFAQAILGWALRYQKEVLRRYRRGAYPEVVVNLLKLFQEYHSENKDFIAALELKSVKKSDLSGRSELRSENIQEAQRQRELFRNYVISSYVRIRNLEGGAEEPPYPEEFEALLHLIDSYGEEFLEWNPFYDQNTDDPMNAPSLSWLLRVMEKPMDLPDSFYLFPYLAVDSLKRQRQTSSWLKAEPIIRQHIRFGILDDLAVYAEAWIKTHESGEKFFEIEHRAKQWLQSFYKYLYEKHLPLTSLQLIYKTYWKASEEFNKTDLINIWNDLYSEEIKAITGCKILMHPDSKKADHVVISVSQDSNLNSEFGDFTTKPIPLFSRTKSEEDFADFLNDFIEDAILGASEATWHAEFQNLKVIHDFRLAVSWLSTILLIASPALFFLPVVGLIQKIILVLVEIVLVLITVGFWLTRSWARKRVILRVREFIHEINRRNPARSETRQKRKDVKNISEVLKYTQNFVGKEGKIIFVEHRPAVRENGVEALKNLGFNNVLGIQHINQLRSASASKAKDPIKVVVVIGSHYQRDPRTYHILLDLPFDSSSLNAGKIAEIFKERLARWHAGQADYYNLEIKILKALFASGTLDSKSLYETVLNWSDRVRSRARILERIGLVEIIKDRKEKSLRIEGERPHDKKGTFYSNQYALTDDGRQFVSDFQDDLPAMQQKLQNLRREAGIKNRVTNNPPSLTRRRRIAVLKLLDGSSPSEFMIAEIAAQMIKDGHLKKAANAIPILRQDLIDMKKADFIERRQEGGVSFYHILTRGHRVVYKIRDLEEIEAGKVFQKMLTEDITTRKNALKALSKYFQGRDEGPRRSELRKFQLAPVLRPKADTLWAAGIIDGTLSGGVEIPLSDRQKASQIVAETNVRTFAEILKVIGAHQAQQEVFRREQERLLEKVEALFPDLRFSFGVIFPPEMNSVEINDLRRVFERIRAEDVAVQKRLKWLHELRMEGLHLRQIDFANPGPAEESMAVAVMENQEGLALENRFMPFTSEGTGQINNYFVRRHTRFLHLLSTGLASALLKQYPQLRGNPEALLGKLLEIFGSEEYQFILNLKGQGVDVNPMAVSFWEYAAARAEVRKAA
ncbi:MAG: methyltransferase domain-containing protein [Candidatus Omnitrophica bacterium]|nr:methyltransferase domain-containing protein [Candidatus Omnitrophota bacterium]